MVPTQDSVSEFKVQYNNLGPEWGKFAGGVINISTKSGTNELHGELYEYLRNRVLNANEFFNKTSELQSGRETRRRRSRRTSLAEPSAEQRSRTRPSSLAAMKGSGYAQGTVYTTTVPTPAERTGNFSAPGLPTNHYDPLSVNPNCPANSQLRSHGIRGQYHPVQLALIRLPPTCLAFFRCQPTMR